MKTNRDALIFAVTLVVALLGAAGSADPQGADDASSARAAATVPAVRS